MSSTMSDVLPAGSRSYVVDAAGTRLHCVEAGEGPLVLFIHGFPESWYSWRHQLPALAEAGYRAVAIDVRGYGRSSKPIAIEDYRMVRLVADNVALVDALGEERAVIIGHDWGAPIAWTSALLRPEVFRAVGGLSVPYSPPSPNRPLAVLRALAGDEEFYIEYFQEPGRAEAEAEEDVRDWIRGFLVTASGDAPPPDPSKGTMATIAHGTKMKDRFHRPDELPKWLTEADLDFYVSELEHSGLRGPLNKYRTIDRDWEDLAAWRGASIHVPALFIGGDRDGPTVWGAGAIANFAQTLPELHRSIILEGCGHWTQQERPDEVNEALLDFLASLL
jgi:pimeloyl-ACP methyl ester carboxylesterase